MLWYALLAATLVTAAALLFTRDIKQALRYGAYTLGASIILALLIVYSGLVGG